MAKYFKGFVLVVLSMTIFFFPSNVIGGGGLSCESDIQKPIQLASLGSYMDDNPLIASQNYVCPENHGECKTNLCKDSNGRYLCCPSDNPYLSLCNCLCYESYEAATSAEEAQCPKYTVCR